MLSEPELLPEKEARMREIRSIGLTEEFATCPPDWTNAVHEHLVQKYGSVEEYLRHIGVDDGMQEKVRGVLLGNR